MDQYMASSLVTPAYYGSMVALWGGARAMKLQIETSHILPC